MSHTFEISNGILILKFSGGLLAFNSNFELTELIQEKISESILLCAVDISEVSHINSSGLGFLVTILTKFRNKGGNLYHQPFRTSKRIADHHQTQRHLQYSGNERRGYS